MMKHFWIVSLIAACWLCPRQAFSMTGKNSAIHFTRISIESGLSQSTIFSIAQDRTGNIWFATYDGVNKYDGYEFTVYQHIMNDTTSLADDISRTLCSDLAGRIWEPSVPRGIPTRGHEHVEHRCHVRQRASHGCRRKGVVYG